MPKCSQNMPTNWLRSVYTEKIVVVVATVAHYCFRGIAKLNSKVVL